MHGIDLAGIVEKAAERAKVKVKATGAIYTTRRPVVGQHVRGVLETPSGRTTWETSSVITWELDDAGKGFDQYTVETRNSIYTVIVLD